MMLAEDENSPRQVSLKLTRGKETTVIWHINGWNCGDKDDFNFLKANAACLVEVDPGFSGSGRAMLGPVTSLRFYFGDYMGPDTLEFSTHHGDNVYVEMEYLSIIMEQVSNKGGQVVKYDLRVESVDEKLNPITSDENPILAEKKTQPFKTGTEKEVLKQDFIHLSKNCTSYPGEPPSTVFKRQEDLRLKITVTPFFVGDDAKGEANIKVDEESSLCLGLKGLLAAEENYADLKLKTKDGMTLSAHKVILAARSPVLREMLEKEVKNNDFTGTIKLPDVNAKPMVVIIHWMYTGELQENAGNCMDEVVNAAIQFQLTGLIKILDKKVITICNPENMFDLFQVAKKNGMPKATEEIAKFIKENLD